MTLKALFAIPIAIILIVTLSLAGMIAGQGWSSQARGRIAVEAVERMQLLLELQIRLRAERVVSNFVLGKPLPLPEPAQQRLDEARRRTDQGVVAVAAVVGAGSGAGAATPELYITTVVVRLQAVRATIDELLAHDKDARAFSALDTVMPRMLAVSQPTDSPLQQASFAVARADPGLSGLLMAGRLADSSRYQIGLAVAVLLPWFDKGLQPSDADMKKARDLLDRASYLTNLLSDTFEIAGATEQIRTSLAEAGKFDVNGIMRQLMDQAGSEASDVRDDTVPLLPQRILAPWAERLNTLRSAIVSALVERVTTTRAVRDQQFNIALTAFGAVVISLLEAVVLLRQRVVGPLAQLGIAITRIAAGDRSMPLIVRSGTREINEMVTAVETLRQAALVADATVLRHRMAAQHRLEMLREALGIARTVQEPARTLERGVASLCEGIDATIALITAATNAPPATLGVAATAVRVGLAEMRAAAAELDATFTAADSAQTEDRPEAEFLAHILAVQAHVDRRDLAVRGFVLPSLVALRDASAATGEASGPGLRDLVSDQFARIEETVAVIAAMSATVTRASAIVRDLSLYDAPMAA